MSIGENIKTFRELRNMSQYELSQILGVSDKTVSSWEINRTEPKMGMIEKICKALDCKKIDIIGNDETENQVSYYINSETREIAQKIYENKDLSLLFDAARDAEPEDLQTVHTMLMALKKKEKGEE